MNVVDGIIDELSSNDPVAAQIAAIKEQLGFIINNSSISPQAAALAEDLQKLLDAAAENAHWISQGGVVLSNDPDAIWVESGDQGPLEDGTYAPPTSPHPPSKLSPPTQEESFLG